VINLGERCPILVKQVSDNKIWGEGQVICPGPSKGGICLQSCNAGCNEVQKTCPGVPMWTRDKGNEHVVTGQFE